MTDLARVQYLIAKGEAINAAQWARKLASEAFHNNYSLRVYATSKHLTLVVGTRTIIVGK